MASIGGGASLRCVDLSSGISRCSPASHPAVAVGSSQRRARALRLEETRTTGKWDLGSQRGGGAGLLERPNFDQTQSDSSLPVQEGGDVGKLTGEKGIGSGDSFRVLLIDDPRHSVTLVEKALPQAVPLVSPEEARQLFHESRQQGVAIVIVAVKEHAEFYAQMMMRSGMRSVIEPDSA